MSESVHGFGPEEVRSVFASLFTDFGEAGSSFSVYSKGRCIASLYGGEATVGQPWDEETLVNVFSASKGALSISLLTAIAEHNIKLDQKLGEFLSDCSDRVSNLSIACLLSHRSGLVAFHAPVPDEALYDYAAMLAMAKSEFSWFSDQNVLAYSPFLWGWLVHDLLRAIRGAEPVISGVNYGALGNQVAKLQPLTKPLKGHRQGTLKSLMGPNGQPMTRAAFLNPLTQMVGTNGDAWRSSIIPAANGHASAVQLAESYNRFLALDGVEAMATNELSSGLCKTTGTPMRFSAGFMLPQGTEDTMFGSLSGGFGHSGAGGSFACGDFKHNFSMAFVSRSMGQSLFMDERGIRLVRAVFNYLGVNPFE